MKFVAAFLCACWATGSAARAIGHLEPRQASNNTEYHGAVPPKEDPWYKAPANFERARPGQILKTREVPVLASVTGNASAAYQLLYRTTDSRYKPSWAVTTIFAPFSNISCNSKLVSYQIPYNTPDLNTSPSYELYRGPAAVFGTQDITTLLGRGWWVVLPDHEGPLASFGAGVTQGHAVLDSVRASLRHAKQHGLNRDARYALWGYSGGGIATNWATELQVQYAPELQFAGTAMGGLIPNTTSLFLNVNGTLFAGLLPMGIVGLTTQYPEASAYIQSQLLPSGPFNGTTFNSVVNRGLFDSIFTFGQQNINNYFRDGFDALLHPVFHKAVTSDGLNGYHGVPQMPTFVYKAINDQLSPIADTDKLVKQYCDGGASISYTRNSKTDHFSEQFASDSKALDFLESVAAGTYTASGCQFSNVTLPN